YNPTDREVAFKKSLEWGDKIPLGVIYKTERPIFEEQFSVIKDFVLVKQKFNLNISEILQEFY
ncbi:MAG TPA: 2-oxoacid ferredoxin oxidoreductase, partial [Thermodesulfovibrio thiophilus]|nr:2-oxoacid ferredoxin oxidoreductase [Thermodesulfovibrio thiophilus]